MTKHHTGGSGWALAAVCTAIALVAAPVNAITMDYIQQAGFFLPSGQEGGDGQPGDTPIAGQGGLEFFHLATPAAPPPPPNTYKGVAWGCQAFTFADCANGGTIGNGTTLVDERLNPNRSSLYLESTAGTLTGTFQNISTITHINKQINGNFLEAVDINLFLRLGPSNLILGGPAPRVFHIDFNETINAAGCTNQPPTGTHAPINPLGSTCDDYAIVSALDLSSVFLPAGSPFGNVVPAFIDFQLSAIPGSGALVCNGVPGQQPAACGTYVGPDVIVYTAEGSTNTVTIQARIREVTIGQPTPLFVIGDVEPHALGNIVNFWGAQWWKNNQMSGFVANGVASFKGYASNAQDFCGGVWQSRPGNSSDPPDSIPLDVVIIVTDTVTKQGPNIGGTIKQLVLVHQDGNYGPNPGHRGGGPVTQIICTSP